jgi:hypothetical protein
MDATDAITLSDEALQSLTTNYRDHHAGPYHDREMAWVLLGTGHHVVRAFPDWSYQSEKTRFKFGKTVGTAIAKLIADDPARCVLGTVHTHPRGPNILSPFDQRECGEWVARQEMFEGLFGIVSRVQGGIAIGGGAWCQFFWVNRVGYFRPAEVRS